MTTGDGLSLAEGFAQAGIPLRELWVGVAALGGDLSEFELEAYVLELMTPDDYSHNLIAQALNEVSMQTGRGQLLALASGEDPARPDPEVSLDLDLDPQTWSVLDKLSRSLHVRGGDLQQTLEAVLGVACQVINGADAAGLNLFERGRFVPQAVSGSAPHELDVVQQSTGAGPCIEASRDQVVVEVPDMSDEARWPQFVARARELGVQSMLCVPLWVDDVKLGSLSLYSTAARSRFDGRTRTQAAVLATHASLALSDAQRASHLRQALVNRDTIGQAKGILMTRHGITADTAFDWLSTASQQQNVKLVRVAEAVTVTGELHR